MSTICKTLLVCSPHSHACNSQYIKEGKYFPPGTNGFLSTFLPSFQIELCAMSTSRCTQFDNHCYLSYSHTCFIKEQQRLKEFLWLPDKTREAKAFRYDD
ncbi:hypothetical protein CW304_22175 [Bacillus sp. UFRGS-B20]|nr:hypothetical protein CW304_22175 [Bacillus sp. UFRGS-B20]